MLFLDKIFKIDAIKEINKNNKYVTERSRNRIKDEFIGLILNFCKN